MDQTSQTCSLAILSIETFRSDRSISLTKSGRMRGRAMMLLARTLWRAVLLSAPMLLLPAPAWAQGYPVRPIKLVVPFPAGGPSDFFSRILAHGLSAELGQQVVLENRTGAGGATGVDSV